MRQAMNCALILEDGTRYPGTSFGSRTPISGEVVFTTGMTGYPQFLTDPSFAGQIVVSTYPLIGNYGVPDMERDRWGIPLGFESDRIQARGLVVAEHCEAPSHHAARRSLDAWLGGEAVPGISGIDTRALTKHLRERGVMRGSIVPEGMTPPLPAQDRLGAVAEASCADVIEYGAAGAAPHVLLVDCGVKANILRVLLARGARVTRVPWNHDFSGMRCDGVFLSNGPGDPKECGRTIASLRRRMAGSTPIFGICLGNQLLALAAGADTYKLPYGHRSQNQPCVEAGTDRCYITSQNHGYAVRADSLPAGWEPWFLNANDGTIEGIRSADGRFRAVQFHPEGCPGPTDTEFLIDDFLAAISPAANGGRK